MRIFKKISVRFSLILKGISAFSTYCFLNNLYSTKYTTYALEQLICEKSYMFFAYVDSGKLMLSWQQRVLLFPKHREHFLRFKMLLFIFVTMFFYICYCQWVSWYFLSRLKSVTGSFWKFVFKDLLTDCLSQFF